MHLEEVRQQQPGVIGQVPPVSVLDLRQVRLADGTARFLPDRPHDFLLRHLAAETAQRAFHLPQVPKFFAESHISISNMYIAIRNKSQEKKCCPSVCGRSFPSAAARQKSCEPLRARERYSYRWSARLRHTV